MNLSNYMDLPPNGQKVWRKAMMHHLTGEWMKAIQEIDYEGGLCDFVRDAMEAMEMEQEYETCAGIRDMIDEYSERLYC